MPLTTKILALLLAVPPAVAAAAGTARPAGEKLKIIATVLPLAEFARDIAGDRGEVSLLLPPGADVHTWQPRIGDIRKLEAASLLLSVGQGLEPWLESLVKGTDAGKLARFTASEGMPLLRGGEEEREEAEHAGHAHGGFDPHLWLDFGLDAVIADGLAAVLSRLDPEGSEIYVRNAAGLKTRLAALDASYRAVLGKYAGRKIFIGGHAAFSYLARRYGLVQVAVYGLSPDAAPSPREIASVIEQARREGVTTVFYEPGTGDRIARMLAAEIGADVRLLHPGHNLDPGPTRAEKTFFRLMEENLESLKHGLAGR